MHLHLEAIPYEIQLPCVNYMEYVHALFFAVRFSQILVSQLLVNVKGVTSCIKITPKYSLEEQHTNTKILEK